MSLAFEILGFLNYGNMSGYDLAKAFGSSLEFFWHAQNSHIYLELKKLEKKGYIRGETVVQSERPNKRIFSITDTGNSRLILVIAISKPVWNEQYLLSPASFYMRHYTYHIVGNWFFDRNRKFLNFHLEELP